jgi:hypothetical protein
VLTVVQSAVPHLYSWKAFHRYAIRQLEEARLLVGSQHVFYLIAVSECGKQVAQRSWFVALRFPDAVPQKSEGSGQLYVTRTPSGWRVWFVYH